MSTLPQKMQLVNAMKNLEEKIVLLNAQEKSRLVMAMERAIQMDFAIVPHHPGDCVQHPLQERAMVIAWVLGRHSGQVVVLVKTRRRVVQY